jgi:hypothetical protein
MTTVAIILYLIGVLGVGSVCLFFTVLGNGIRFTELLWAITYTFGWPIMIPIYVLRFIYSMFSQK